MLEPSYNTYYHKIRVSELSNADPEERLDARLERFCSARDIFDAEAHIPTTRNRHYKLFVFSNNHITFAICAVIWCSTSRTENGRHLVNNWVRKHSIHFTITVPYKGPYSMPALQRLQQSWCERTEELLWPYKKDTLKRLYEEQCWSNKWPSLEAFMMDDSRVIHHSHIRTPDYKYNLIGFAGALALLTHTPEEAKDLKDRDSELANRLNRAHRGGIYDHLTFIRLDFCYYPEHAYDRNVLLDFIRVQYSVAGIDGEQERWRWVKDNYPAIVKDLHDRIEHARRGYRIKIPSFLDRLKIDNFALFTDGLIDVVVEPKNGEPIRYPNCRKNPSPTPRQMSGEFLHEE